MSIIGCEETIPDLFGITWALFVLLTVSVHEFGVISYSSEKEEEVKTKGQREDEPKLDKKKQKTQMIKIFCVAEKKSFISLAV